MTAVLLVYIALQDIHLRAEAPLSGGPSGGECRERGRGGTAVTQAGVRASAAALVLCVHFVRSLLGTRHARQVFSCIRGDI